MSQQIQISGGAKVRNLQDVIIGTSGVLSSLAFDVANGVPKLDSNGKILVSQLPNSVMEYKGTWNAATNTPTLANGTGNQGDVWLCTTPGTVNFGAGPITFISGDSAVYSGSIWQRSGGATGTVTSVGASITGSAIGVTGSPITTAGTLAFAFLGTNLEYVNGAGNLTTFPILTGYVPYTGATQDVDLDTFKLNAQSIHAKGTGGLGHFGMKHQSASATASANEVSLFADSLGDFSWLNGNLYLSKFITSSNTAARSYTFPDATCNIPNDSLVVHLAGTETITGAKTFTGSATFNNTLGNSIILNYGAALVKGNTPSSTSGVWSNIYAAAGNNNLVIADNANISKLQFQAASTYTYTFPAATGTIALTSDLAGYLTAVTATYPLSSSGGTTPNITIPLATAITDGYLSDTDWFVFNSKQAALSGTGFVKISGTTISYDNSTYYLASNPSAFIALTALSAGVGISYNNTTGVITNSAPDQVVALTASTGISVTGTYPNFTITNTSPSSGGTVTSVAALTIGTSGTDLSSSVANSTTTPVITLNVPTASATNRGALASADWTTFNNKQGTITLTTTGTSGAATFSANTLNIPNYGSALSGYLPLTGGTLTGALGGTSASFSSTSYTNLTLNGTNATGWGNNIAFQSGGTDFGYVGSIGSLLGNTTKDMTIWATAGNGFRVYTNGNNLRLNIDSSGNTSIGYTTNPSLYQLDVNGTGRFSGALSLNQANGGVLFLQTAGTNNSLFTTTLQIQGSGSSTDLNAYVYGANDFGVWTNGTKKLTIASTGAATFSSSVNANAYGLAGVADAMTWTTNTLRLGQGSYWNNIELWNGTTIVLKTTSGGNVGIGTSSPSGLARALVVSNTSDYPEVIVERLSSGAGKYGFLVGNDGSWLFRNYTAGTNPFIIASTGAATFSSSVTSSTSTNANFVATTSSASGYSYIDFINTGASGKTYEIGIGGSSTASGYANNMYFDLAGVGTIMTLTSGRNVLIGTQTDSGYKLDVNGTGRFTGQLHIPNNSTGTNAGLFFDYNANVASRSWCIVSDYDAYGDFQIQQSTTQTGSTYSKILGFSSTGAATFSSSVTAISSNFTTTSNTYTTQGTISWNDIRGLILRAKTASVFDFAIYSAAEASMIVNPTGTNNVAFPNGNVLIGTTTNTNHKLTVYNATSASQVRVAGAAPSIVFTDTVTDPATYVGYIGMATAANNFITGAAAGDYVLHNYSGGPILFGINNSEKMRITSGGNVGIGGIGSAGTRLILYGSDTTNSNNALVLYNSASTILFYVSNDGTTNTGLAANSPYNNSQTGRTPVLASNGVLGYLVSTRQSKANIESIKGIDYINQLNPVQFNYRKKDNDTNEYTDELYDNITYGFIADEVEKVNKELVFYNSDGITLAGVEYNSMIAILTKAVQEQQKQIEELKLKIK